MSMPDEDALDDLGRVVARAQREALDHVALRATRQFRARSRRRATTVASAVLVAAAVLLVVWTQREPPALTATVAGRPLEPARWTRFEESTTVEFSDRTTLRVDEGSHARIASLDAHGAVVELERGRLEAAVHHERETRWSFRVGPYEVSVVGTRFDTSWSPEHERFAIRMNEGRVVVRGPRLSEPRTLSAGESLVLTPEPTTPRSEDPEVDSSRASAPAEIEVDDDDDEVRDEGDATSSRRVSVRELDRAFLDHAERGDFALALATAEARGFEGLCDRLGASHLLRLGDVARYAGDRARARAAYLVLRRRFASTEHAADAAYALGLSTGSPREAAAFFETYLREAPHGALAREARGRLFETHRRAGDEAAARRAALDYLAHHPEGPLSEAARVITGPR